MLSLDYDGNVQSATITAPGPAVNVRQTFAYDKLNRLTSASEAPNSGSNTTAWSQVYDFDAVGNRWLDPSSWGLSLSSFTPQYSTNFNANNQLVLQSSTYDSAGNHKTIGGFSYGYDAENRLVSVTEPSGTNPPSYQYIYDGNGQRVQKIASGGPTTTYAYDASGELASEYVTGTPPTPLCTTCLLVQDTLGSTRMMLDAGTGSPVSMHDYIPFGEEIATARTNVLYSGKDNPRQKFSGKERDSETNLDYFGARYYSGAQGRFTSPDPLLNSGRPWEPQSWNRYAYALNNPLKYVDPDGLFEWSANCGNGDKKCLGERERFTSALDRLKQASLKYKEGSSERKELDSVLSLFGDANTKNGVFVGFGYAKGAVGLEWKEGNHVNVKLDLDLFDKGIAGWARSDSRVQPDVELAGIVAHEGTHASDVSLFGNDYILVRGRVAAERSAFDAQSLVNKSFNTLSPYGLWNPSWARVDAVKQERRRDEAVGRNAENAARLGQGLR